MNLDDLLSAAIADGRKAIAEKKKPRLPAQQKRELAAKLLTSEVKREVPVVQKGIFEITCLVAEYVRRTCVNCKHSELHSVPRVFICEQQVNVPSTRRLHRLNNQDSVLSYIRRGLPVKTEVYTSPAPFCRHCIKELLNATRPPSKEPIQSPDLRPSESDPAAFLPISRAVQTRASAPIQERSDQQLLYLPRYQGPSTGESKPTADAEPSRLRLNGSCE